MAKERERSRTPRQRRRYRARSAGWLKRNSVSAPAGHETQRAGTQACHLCGRFFPRKRLTIDHIVARSRWAWASECEAASNKTLVCRGCNQRKGNSMPNHPDCDVCMEALFIYGRVLESMGLELTE